MGMFGTTVDSDAVFDNLVSKALAFAAVEQVGDSSIKNITRRMYDVTESGKITFVGNRGNMSDGLYVNIPGVTEDSYNILTNVVLPISSNGQIDVSNSRFGNNLESIFVFVNGYKVPDSSIWMYMTDSYTNIIIPKKYFNPSITNDILIENRKFEAYTYGGTRVSNFSGSTLQFNISSHRNVIVDINTCMVFNLGKYLPNDVSNVVFNNGVATVTFAIPILNGDIEIFIDSSIKFVKTTQVQNNNIDTNGKYIVPFSIDHTFANALYGPINNTNCMFFFNGLRVDNLEVNQVGRLDFQYEIQRPVNDIVSIIFTDEGVIPLNQFKLYGDDYFLYNMIGATKISGVLCGNSGNTVLDSYFQTSDYLQILNGYLTYDNVTNTINALSQITDGDLKIQKLLQLFPTLVKDFLENFAAKRIRETVSYNGTDPTVIIGTTDQYYTSDMTIIRVITVNDMVVKIDRISVASTFKYWQSTVDGIWFNAGDNIVEIFESVQTADYSVEYKVVQIAKVSTIYDPYVSYRAITPLFGNITDIDDLRVIGLTKRDIDPDGIYFKDEKYGFRIVTGLECPRIIFNNEIYMDFGPIDPRIDMLIVTTVKHMGVFTLTVQDADVNLDSLFNEISIGNENYFDTELNTNVVVKVPLLHNGGMTISTQNGLRLFRDIDYLYRSQLDQTVPMRQSGIILRRFVYNDTQINVVVYPNYTYNMDYPSLSIEDTFDDKYGLLYLGNLKFPFSSKYMDVYANNKHLGEDDIDIISNKLIRLTKSEVSLQDVCIETNFTVPYSALRPFIQLYFDSNFETCIGKLFSCYDYYNNPQIGVVSKASADSLYESFGDEVLTNDSTQLTVQEWVSNILYNINDIVIYNDIIYICSTQNINNIPSGSSKWVVRGKLPNPIRTQEYITTEYNLYVDAYLRWFIGNYSKHIWEDNVNIPDNVLTELQIFRDNSEGDNLDVVVIPYENQLIADIVIDTNPDTYLGFYNGESEKVFLDCCIDNNLLPQDAYDQYDNYIESNIVSKRDLFPIRAIDTFVGDDIIIGGRQ